jgi:hypothetical protein
MPTGRVRQPAPDAGERAAPLLVEWDGLPALDVTPPCCTTATSLDQLDYD